MRHFTSRANYWVCLMLVKLLKVNFEQIFVWNRLHTLHQFEKQLVIALNKTRTDLLLHYVFIQIVSPFATLAKPIQRNTSVYHNINSQEFNYCGQLRDHFYIQATLLLPSLLKLITSGGNTPIRDKCSLYLQYNFTAKDEYLSTQETQLSLSACQTVNQTSRKTRKHLLSTTLLTLPSLHTLDITEHSYQTRIKGVSILLVGKVHLYLPHSYTAVE